MSEQTFCKKHEIVLTLNWGCPYCRIEALELVIKNSPPNSHLREQIKALEKIVDVHDKMLYQESQWNSEQDTNLTELKSVLKDLLLILQREFNYEHDLDMPIELEKIIKKLSSEEKPDSSRCEHLWQDIFDSYDQICLYCNETRPRKYAKKASGGAK